MQINSWLYIRVIYCWCIQLVISATATNFNVINDCVMVMMMSWWCDADLDQQQHTPNELIFKSIVLFQFCSVNFKLIAFDFVWMQKMRICAHIRRIIVISTIFARTKLNLNKIMNNWGDLQCAELFALFGLVN